jgi:hypothetical protein
MTTLLYDKYDNSHLDDSTPNGVCFKANMQSSQGCHIGIFKGTDPLQHDLLMV